MTQNGTSTTDMERLTVLYECPSCGLVSTNESKCTYCDVDRGTTTRPQDTDAEQ